MPRRRTWLIGTGIAGSFLALAVGIVFLSRSAVITPTLAKLMLVALLGLYFGFGALIAIYRLVRRLD